MTEMLKIFDLDGNFIELKDRDEYYKNIREFYKSTSRVETKVKTTLGFLLTSDGKICIQRRSESKSDNRGLYDKSVGGHVVAEDSFDDTFVKECTEELGVHLEIVENLDEVDTVGYAICIEIDEEFLSTRLLPDASVVVEANICAFYIGYYDGEFTFLDGEVDDLVLYSLDELKQEIESNPEKFTEDLKWMVKKYEKYLCPLTKRQ